MVTQIAAGIFGSAIALALFLLILKLVRDTLQTKKTKALAPEEELKPDHHLQNPLLHRLS